MGGCTCGSVGYGNGERAKALYTVDPSHPRALGFHSRTSCMYFMGGVSQIIYIVAARQGGKRLTLVVGVQFASRLPSGPPSWGTGRRGHLPQHRRYYMSLSRRLSRDLCPPAGDPGDGLHEPEETGAHIPRSAGQSQGISAQLHKYYPFHNKHLFVDIVGRGRTDSGTGLGHHTAGLHASIPVLVVVFINRIRVKLVKLLLAQRARGSVFQVLLRQRLPLNPSFALLLAI